MTLRRARRDSPRRFVDAVNARMEALTPSQEHLARYLLRQLPEAAFSPIERLARDVGVSKATVVRFAKALGFSGYHEMRRSEQQFLREALSPAGKIKGALNELTAAGYDGLLKSFVVSQTKLLEENLDTVSERAFSQAVSLLLAGERRFVFGTGATAYVCEMLRFRFERLGLPSYALTQTGQDLFETLVLMRPSDTLLAFAFFQAGQEAQHVLDHARRIGAHRILITDAVDSTLVNLATVTLFITRGRPAAFHSLHVPVLLADALILAMANEQRDRALHHLKRLQSLRDRYGDSRAAGQSAPGAT